MHRLASLVAAGTLALFAAGADADGVLCGLRSYFGALPLDGFATRVQVADGRAYLVRRDGIAIIDIADAAAPVLLGTYDTPHWTPLDLEIIGNLGYLAGGGNGLSIVDLSDPVDPALRGSYNAFGATNALEVSGNTVYVAAGAVGLRLLDVSDPSTPLLISEFLLPGEASDVVLVGTHVIVSQYDEPFAHILDVTDPSSPTLVATYKSRILPRVLHVADETLYITGDGQGLEIVDISDLASPVALSFSEEHNLGHARRLTVAEDIAYIACGPRGVEALDVSDPRSPRRIGWIGGPGEANDLHSASGVLYLADGFAGLLIANITTFPAPPELASRPTAAYIVRVRGHLACLGERDRLVTLDVSDPSSPLPLGSIELPEVPRAIDIVQDTAYVAADGLQIVDLSDPAAPCLLGAYDSAGEVRDVQVIAAEAYLADSVAGLLILDVSTPEAPELLASLNTPGSARRVRVLDQLAYIADGPSGLTIVDITDPSSPLLLSVTAVPGAASGVDVSGSHAFVADGNQRVHMLDVSDPNAPILASSFFIPLIPFACEDLLIAHGRAHVIGSLGAVTPVLDVTNPAHPRIQAFLPAGGALDIVNDTAFLASTGEGLQILDLSDCPPCPADFNDDGLADSRDVIAFLNAWVLERTQDCSSGDCSTDLDDNGFVDTRDFIVFLNAWAAGC